MGLRGGSSECAPPCARQVVGDAKLELSHLTTRARDPVPDTRRSLSHLSGKEPLLNRGEIKLSDNAQLVVEGAAVAFIIFESRSTPHFALPRERNYSTSCAISFSAVAFNLPQIQANDPNNNGGIL